MLVVVSVIGWFVAPWLMVLLWFLGGPVLKANVAAGFLFLVKLFVVLVALALVLALFQGLVGPFLGGGGLIEDDGRDALSARRICCSCLDVC